MKIEYKGRNLEENRNYREAWIEYDDTKKSEEEKADKIAKILEEKGWKVACEYGWIGIRVYDKEEYQEVVEDYKEAKKKIRQEQNNKKE